MQRDCFEDSFHVNMIVNLLVKFPEIFTITYNLASSAFCLSYMINEKVSREEFLELRRLVEVNLEAFSFFKKKEPDGSVKLRKKTFYGFTQLEVLLTGDNLIGEEFSLITNIIKESCGEKLISELKPEEVDLLEDSATTWDEMLSYLLNRKSGDAAKNLFAFRDAGKVYVFDK